MQGDRSICYLTPRQIVEKYPTELCLQILPNGALQIKRSHRFYTQVQGELAVKGYSWADFVVWTNARSANVFVGRISLDEKFWKSALLPALEEFFTQHVASKILFLKIAKFQLDISRRSGLDDVSCSPMISELNSLLQSLSSTICGDDTSHQLCDESCRGM